MTKLLAALVLVPLSLALCCATCVSGLLPVGAAFEVAPSQEIAAPELPRGTTPAAASAASPGRGSRPMTGGRR